jgi:hypothetical protein
MSRTAVASRPTRTVLLAALIVAAAAAVPYLSTLNNYFVRDDFGVVQLLSRKPASYFPRWFVSSWMDDIWGHIPDEVRPFPAVSYQLTSLGGAASPFLHHALNVGLHVACGLLVLAIAWSVFGLGAVASTFAAVVFVLLPVHGESVAWITGRVDSMPAFFYLASFLAFARWRQGGSARATLYATSLAMLFIALFTKQTTITMVATLAAWDLLTFGWPSSLWPWVRVYVPFVALTMAYLALRFVLFGQVVRESQLNGEGLPLFARLVGRHLANVIAGDVRASAVAWTVLILLTAVAWWLLRTCASGERRQWIGRLVYAGPIWWVIGVAPIAVAGYESPRHVYLAAAGWALVLGILVERARQHRASVAWRWSVAALALAVIAFYAVKLHGVVEDWNDMAAVSRRAVVDVRAEALSLPAGSLMIVGAPTRSWEWAVPFSVRPPYTRVDLTEKVFIVTPWLLHCCRSQWFDDTRGILRTWTARHTSAPIVVLRWDPETGAPARISDREYPPLRSLVPVLLELNSRDALDAAMLKIVEQLPVPKQP